MGPLNHESRASKRTTMTKEEIPIELKKEFIEAENLTEEEQMRIRKEAHKKANNKMKSTETKIEGDMISMLENECNKLGTEVEK